MLFTPGADEDTLVWISNFTWQGDPNYLFHRETKINTYHRLCVYGALGYFYCDYFDTLKVKQSFEITRFELSLGDDYFFNKMYLDCSIPSGYISGLIGLS